MDLFKSSAGLFVIHISSYCYYDESFRDEPQGIARLAVISRSRAYNPQRFKLKTEFSSAVINLKYLMWTPMKPLSEFILIAYHCVST
jgi:hypothetical protein